MQWLDCYCSNKRRTHVDVAMFANREVSTLMLDCFRSGVWTKVMPRNKCIWSPKKNQSGVVREDGDQCERSPSYLIYEWIG